MKRTAIFVTVFFLFFSAAAGITVLIGLQLLRAPSPTSVGFTTFTVRSGEGAKGIGTHLKDAQLIRNRFVFELYVWSEGVSADLKAGDYQLSPAMDVATIVRLLKEGIATGNEVAITIPEGWSLRDIGSSLVNDKHLFEAEAWEQAAKTTDSRTIIPDKTFSFLSDKPSGATLEGYLFPDTYRVYRNAKPAEVIQKTLENFSAKVSEDRIAALHAQGKTLFDVLIIASIIEREVRTDSDRRLVADIFWKRLRDGMPLQSDATVNYLTGKKTTRPTLDDLAIDSPYNTYKYQGLPPGPINNPGLASILAAADPEPNPYYYFLTTDDGTTVFGRTLEEHNANRAKYLGP